MKVSGPTIMSFCSVIQVAPDLKHFVSPAQIGRCGIGAVLSVNWLVQHGDTVTSISENWRKVAPDTFVATSPKR